MSLSQALWRMRFCIGYFFCLILLSSQLGGGCATTTNEGGYSTNRNDRYDHRYDTRYEEDKQWIPSNARLIKEGRGEIGFRCGSNGRVYVLNSRNREVVYTDDLLEGDTFTVLPDDNRIRINGRDHKKELKRDDVHRIYFDGRRSHYGDTSDRPGYNRSGDRPRPAEVKRPVPDSAKLMAETSRGGEVSFKASSNGKAYLYDNSNNVLVGTFTVKKGQRLTFNIEQGLGTLDGRQVFKKSLSQRANYRLLFDE